jgi:photosystem II stability/assembly factor-like uncharacterized protein
MINKYVYGIQFKSEEGTMKNKFLLFTIVLLTSCSAECSHNTILTTSIGTSIPITETNTILNPIQTITPTLAKLPLSTSTSTSKAEISTKIATCKNKLTSNSINLVVNPISPTSLFISQNCSGVIKSIDGGNNWSNINGVLEGMQINDIAIDPIIPTNLYAGTQYNGIFKSVDGGNNWYAINIGLNNSSIYSLAIDPITTKTIYAGGKGEVYKSVDGGNNWISQKEGLDRLYILTIAIDPVNTNNIYAGTNSYGVIVSKDGGATWEPINYELVNIAIQSIAINPKTPTTIFAGAQGTFANRDHDIEGSGVIVSLNGGYNWSFTPSSTQLKNVWALIISPEEPEILYAGVEGIGVYIGGIYKSTNASKSWILMDMGTADTGIISLAMDPVSPNTLYAGSNSGNIYKSINGGEIWNLIYSIA